MEWLCAGFNNMQNQGLCRAMNDMLYAFYSLDERFLYDEEYVRKSAGFLKFF